MSIINAKIVGRGVNAADYHANKLERGDTGHSVSSSMLKEFVKCPRRWRTGYQPPESAAKSFGSLLDCRLLTPKQFDARYVVQPETYQTNELKCPQCGSVSDAKHCRACRTEREAATVTKDWNGNSNTCKEWLEQQAKSGFEVVSRDDIAEVEAAIKRLLADDILRAWHEACETQVWVTAQWDDEATGLVVPLKCLIDYEPRKESEFARCLGDLKSAASGSLRFFQRNVFTLGYHLQAAFDLALYNAATGEEREHWCFVGIENFAPFEPFRRMIDERFLALGQWSFDTALRRYCQSLSRDEWPGYDDHEDAAQGWSICAPEPWMEYDAASDKMAESMRAELSTEQKIEMAGL